MASTKSIIPASVRPFVFSLLVVSSLSVKGLHLGSHLRSLSPSNWVVLLPFLFSQDAALAILGRLLLARSTGRWKVFDAGLLGFVLTVITAVAAAMEIAFFWETSGEINWGEAGKFLCDPAGMKLLLSGMTTVLGVLASLVILAKASASSLYNAMGNGLHFATRYFRNRFRNIALHQQSLRYKDEEKSHKEFRSVTIRELNINISLSATKHVIRNIYPFAFAILYVTVLVLYTGRTENPYKHLSGSLPFTLIWSSERNDNEFCAVNDNLDRRPFPLADLVTEKAMKDARDFSTGWAPWKFTSGKGKPLDHVNWLPKEPVTGFQRWYKTNSFSDSIHYDPRYDPLRISNAQSPILDTLQEAFQQSNIAIKNVMMITLESTRKDVFPLKKSSHLHKIILSSHERSANLELSELLANISRTSEMLTGESSGLESTKGNNISPIGTWRNLTSGFGGLNVPGAISSSTYTLKNLVTSHCGVGSLPVDFAKEAFHDIYQPCLPHVLGLFNTQKRSVDRQNIENFRSQIWDTAYVQAVTDYYDDQSTLTKKMGFSVSVARDQLRHPESMFYPPTEPDSNYFGYPESQVKPYIRDIIERARDNSHRFFISHLTSTTHHPWALPPAFGKPRDYMGHKGWQDHKDINDYLNTVKYADVWLGEIMDMLEDTGVANETLVVVIGDHGFAFREDDSSYSTYNGAHINNFRIPMVFYHPKIPRVQLSMNASTMSVLPTILDLLVSSNSLDEADRNAASHLLNEYEGQSLVREYHPKHHGRQVWHFSLMNPGGMFLAISSAAFPWRLIMPLCQTALLRFTDLSRNDMEQEKLEDWSIDNLRNAVATEYGSEAAQWVVEAKKVATWWYWERRRLWKFGGSSWQVSPELPRFGENPDQTDFTLLETS